MTNMQGLLLISFLLIALHLFDICYARMIENKDHSNAQLQRANLLSICQGCRQYSRDYQQRLQAVERPICPHCKGSELTHVKQTDPWMDTHRDCPKIDRKKWKRVQREIEILKVRLQEEAAWNRMREYEGLRTTEEWVQQVQNKRPYQAQTTKKRP